MVRFDLLIILLCMVCVFLPLCISSNLSLDPRCFEFYLVDAGYFCVPIHLLLFWITKLKRFYWEIQSIWIHLMCVETHDNTLQVSNFIRWVELKHLPSKSFVHSITLFFFVTNLSACSTSQYYFQQNFFLLEERYQFQMLGCMFVTELSIVS